jgi:hypothetical protein
LLPYKRLQKTSGRRQSKKATLSCAMLLCLAALGFALFTGVGQSGRGLAHVGDTRLGGCSRCRNRTA